MLLICFLSVKHERVHFRALDSPSKNTHTHTHSTGEKRHQIQPWHIGNVCECCGVNKSCSGNIFLSSSSKPQRHPKTMPAHCKGNKLYIIFVQHVELILNLASNHHIKQYRSSAEMVSARKSATSAALNLLMPPNRNINNKRFDQQQKIPLWKPSVWIDGHSSESVSNGENFRNFHLENGFW